MYIPKVGGLFSLSYNTSRGEDEDATISPPSIILSSGVSPFLIQSTPSPSPPPPPPTTATVDLHRSSQARERSPPSLHLSLSPPVPIFTNAAMGGWGEERDGGRTRSGALYEVGTLAAEAADYKYVSGISFGAQTCCTFYIT